MPPTENGSFIALLDQHHFKPQSEAERTLVSIMANAFTQTESINRGDVLITTNEDADPFQRIGGGINAWSPYLPWI